MSSPELPPDAHEATIAFEQPDPSRPATAAPTEPQLESERLPATATHDPYSALRYRDCRLYIAGWVIAIAGSQIQSTAVGWELFKRTGNALSLGWAGLVQALPVMLLSLPAGMLADRFDRRKILAFTQMGAACCSILLALLVFHTHHPPAAPGRVSLLDGTGIIYAVLALGAVFQAIGWPARSAILPATVPAEHFANAATWSSSGMQTASVLGPAMGGVLLLWSTVSCFAVDAALEATFAGLILMLAANPPAKRVATSLASLSAGLRFVFARPLILAPITLDLFAVLLGGAVYILPVYAKDILHVGEARFGMLRAAPAVGAVMMALALAHRPPMKKAGQSMLLAVTGFGIATIVFGISRNFWLSLAMLAMTGACDNISVVVRHTLVQVMTPDAMRGRVSAVNNIFIGASNELGGFESGLAARLLGTVPSVVLGGVGTLLVVIGANAIWPQVRRFGSLQMVEADADVGDTAGPAATASA